ncbi:hypothetical protein ACTSKR_03695 [Chitinibacteraceae bacterium HSL-7]
MTGLNIDLNIDKHQKATLVVACPDCGHEVTHRLGALTPDSVLGCQCGARISLTPNDLDRANALHQRIITH